MKFRAFFKNRCDAGEQLATYLQTFIKDKPIILAIPNGGVPVALTLSEKLNLPAYLAPIKKIKHPENDNINIGAVSVTNQVINHSMDVNLNEINEQINLLKNDLRKDLTHSGNLKAPPLLHDKSIVVVDDGITFGSTMMATLQLLEMEHPARKILAVPVATHRSLSKLRDYVDDIVCLHTTENVTNVSAYYQNFGDMGREDLASVVNGYYRY